MRRFHAYTLSPAARLFRIDSTNGIRSLSTTHRVLQELTRFEALLGLNNEAVRQESLGIHRHVFWTRRWLYTKQSPKNEGQEEKSARWSIGQFTVDPRLC